MNMILEDMRILVVEDDDKIASFLVKGLKQSGYAVDRCAEGVPRRRSGPRRTALFQLDQE